ncbi:MAG: hypothetical protein R6U85_08535 [Salinivirgaceae bacterium]
MTRKLLLLMAILLVGLMGCNRYIAPPFTNVEKISRIKAGMKLKQVVDILGIDPYNVYHMQTTGTQLLTFNYRLKNRKLKVETFNRDEFNRRTTNEESQTAGDLHYDKDYKTLYVILKDGEMTSFTTSYGFDDSEYLMIHQNNLNLIGEENISQYENLGDSIPNVEIYQIINNNKRILPGKEGRSTESSFLKKIF